MAGLLRLIWDILEIHPTNDISIIKKAYAQKLKLYHPEDDPVGYQKLREAYDQAAKMAKQSTYESIHDLVDDNHDTESTFEIIKPLVTFKPFTFIDPEPHKQPPTFLELVQALYEDFPTRIRTDPWFELLNNNVLWDLHQFNRISHDLLVYLNDHYFLPRPIWQLLEATFRWKLQAKEDDQFRYVFPKVYASLMEERNVSNLGFSSLLLAGEIDHDAFLRHRELAYISLLDHNMKVALQSIVEGTTLFPDDPDMLLLKAEFYRRIDNTELLLLTCADRIRVSPDNPECYCYRARIWLNHGFIPEAVIDLDQALLLDPTEIRAMALLGQCHVKLGELELARSIYNSILGINSNDIEAILSLAEIDAQVRQWSVADHMDSFKAESKPGILSLLSQLQELLTSISRTWRILVPFIALHIIVIGFFMNNGDHSFFYRITHLHQLQANELITVRTMDDLKASNKAGDAVKIELETIIFSLVCELQRIDSDGNKLVWYDLCKNTHDQIVDIVAYMSISYLDAQPIIVRSSIEELSAVYEDDLKVLDGLIVTPLAPELMKLLNQESSIFLNDRVHYQPANVSYILDSVTATPVKPILLIKTDYLIILLGFLTILLIARLIWVWSNQFAIKKMNVS
jgi:tetratricopeptide (TPR) repeat protein